MLNDSIPSSSFYNPLPMEEGSVDFEIMLMIITGHPQQVLQWVTHWNQTERLYRLVDKYQLEGHRPWFSEICSSHAAEKPWEALFLACNQSHADATIIRAAISQGFQNGPTSIVCNGAYFHITSFHDEDGNRVTTKHQTLDSSNITISLGMNLGFKGLLAYNITFASLASSDDEVEWGRLAERFIAKIREIEKGYRACELGPDQLCRVVHCALTDTRREETRDGENHLAPSEEVSRSAKWVEGCRKRFSITE